MKVTNRFQGRILTNSLAMGFAGLTILLSGLKLTHHSTPSWPLTLAPLLVPFALLAGLGVISVLRTLVGQVESLDQNGLILIENESAERPVRLGSFKLRRIEDL
jgi:hypothetical protein